MALCLVIFGILAFSPSVRPLLKVAMLGMAGVTTFAFVSRLAGTLRRSRTFLDKLGGEVRACLTVDSEGLHLENPLGTSNIPWPFLDSIWVFDDVWLLFIGEVDYMTIPAEALGESGRSEFLRLAGENRKRIVRRAGG